MTTQNNSDVSTVSARLVETLSFKMFIGLIVFLSIIFLSSLYVAKNSAQKVLTEQSEKLNESVVQSITLKLRERLAKTESLTRALARLGTELPKEESVFKRVIPSVLSDTGMDDLVAGGGVWPAPFSFSPDVERRSFFWGKNSAGELEYFEDYNDPAGLGYHNEEWYVPALQLKPGQVYWSKSYIDPYSLEPMVTCTVPMWSDGNITGVATVDLKLKGLSAFMSEQASLTGGYAFALDRNSRLLSKPHVDNWSRIESLLNRPKNADFPTLKDIAGAEPAFSLFAEKLEQAHQQLDEDTEQDPARIQQIAREVSLNSYQVQPNEALVIANQIVVAESGGFSNRMFLIEADPLANEATAISVSELKDIGWRVVVAMPARYANEAVDFISNRINSLLIVLLILTGLFFALFFFTSFIRPVKDLSCQIRHQIEQHDVSTMLDINDRSELGELAHSFNERTNLLRSAMAELEDRNTDLEEMRVVAEEASKSKSIFLASMSHEIRTPMNAIIGMSDVLSDMPLSDEQSDFVKIIRTSSEGLLSLINDIMDFSKVEAGKLDLESIPFDLRAMLDDCADLIAFQASEKNLEFVYFVSPKVPQKVTGDPNRVRQVVLNLMSNAVKFTQSGFVELWVEASEEQDVVGGGDVAALSIYVKDTGVGISQEKVQRLFDPFTQSDSSTTRKYGGTGLGLAISKHLADLMSGKISYQAHPGGGSDFCFQLKLPIAESIAMPGIPPSTDKQNLVAVVRDRESGKALANYAENIGYDFHQFSNAEKWVQSLSGMVVRDAVHIVYELSTLGDFESLLQAVPHNKSRYRLIVVSSIHRRGSVDLSRLEQKFDIEMISAPVKYRELLTAMQRLSERGGQNVVVEHTSGMSPDSSETDAFNSSAKPSIQEKSNPGKMGDNAPHQAEAGSGPLQEYGHRPILVVEDNKVNQKVMMMLLNKMGLNADLAEDGIEAVEIASKKQYDMILMDWQMPRMDGLEATRHIRKLSGYESLPVIAVTANAMSGDLDKCMEAGMDDYISKPLRAEELQLKLSRWLSDQPPQTGTA